MLDSVFSSGSCKKQCFSADCKYRKESIEKMVYQLLETDKRRP